MAVTLAKRKARALVTCLHANPWLEAGGVQRHFQVFHSTLQVDFIIF